MILIHTIDRMEGGPGRNGLANLDENGWKTIIDIWNRLVHVDVEKDHGANYDENIVNGFLSYSRYFTDFSNNELYVAEKGKSITRGQPGGVFNKDNIFNAVMSEQYDTLRNKPYETDGSISVNLTGQTYSYMVFPIVENGVPAQEQATKINTFLGSFQLAGFVDTSNKLNYLVAGGLNMILAHTATVQNDPADKTNKKTGVRGMTEDQKTRYTKQFYLEKTSIQGSTGFLYPPFSYTPADPLSTHHMGLSHFMCRYPLRFTLFPTTEKDKEIGRLNVQLEYIRDGRVIIIEEGSNTASKGKCIEAFTFRKKPDLVAKETLFISKLHGDVAQVLDMYRDIQLENKDNENINTNTLKACFVSLDLNATLKAFTEGIDCIFFYLNLDNKLFVFKNTRLNAPEQIIANLKNEIPIVYKKLESDIAIYNDSVDTMNDTIRRFYTKAGEVLRTRVAETAKNNRNEYIKRIKEGMAIAALLDLIPSETLEPVQPLAPLAQELPNDISELKDILQNIKTKQGELKIPPDYMRLHYMDGDAIARVALEKKFIFTIANNAGRKNIVEKKIDNIWSTVDITKSPTDRGGLFARTATRFQMYWCFDLISHVYEKLKRHTLGVDSVEILYTDYLKDVFEGRSLENFQAGLRLIGADKVQVGGEGTPKPGEKRGREYSPFSGERTPTRFTGDPTAKGLITPSPKRRNPYALLGTGETQEFQSPFYEEASSKEESPTVIRRLFPVADDKVSISILNGELEDIGHLITLYENLKKVDTSNRERIQEQKNLIIGFYNSFVDSVFTEPSENNVVMNESSVSEESNTDNSTLYLRPGNPMSNILSQQEQEGGATLDDPCDIDEPHIFQDENGDIANFAITIPDIRILLRLLYTYRDYLEAREGLRFTVERNQENKRLQQIIRELFDRIEELESEKEGGVEHMDVEEAAEEEAAEEEAAEEAAAAPAAEEAAPAEAPAPAAAEEAVAAEEAAAAAPAAAAPAAAAPAPAAAEEAARAAGAEEAEAEEAAPKPKRARTTARYSKRKEGKSRIQSRYPNKTYKK